MKIVLTLHGVFAYMYIDRANFHFIVTVCCTTLVIIVVIVYICNLDFDVGPMFQRFVASDCNEDNAGKRDRCGPSGLSQPTYTHTFSLTLQGVHTLYAIYPTKSLVFHLFYLFFFFFHLPLIFLSQRQTRKEEKE